MIVGHVRDGFPRLMLSLPGRQGLLNVEFLVDTGFDGALSLPASLAGQLEALFPSDRHVIRLGDGSPGMVISYEITLEWDGELRLTEVMVLENTPLLGVELLAEHLLQVEMIDGGEVTIEPL